MKTFSENSLLKSYTVFYLTTLKFDVEYEAWELYEALRLHSLYAPDDYVMVYHADGDWRRCRVDRLADQFPPLAALRESPARKQVAIIHSNGTATPTITCEVKQDETV